ncbi:zinc-binding alcohol dehydrogenase/oxidoreductase [Rhodococcus sp. 27YEA15]|uniref:zinc-binding dehydrogenase n=1 Tax=Rhodococcus sp. 27YEA15 TaxID=3156259 RepID=UPI003C7CA3CC
MSQEKMMRALVHSGRSGVDGLEIRQVPQPVPGPDEVLVNVMAAGLNRHELFVVDARSGDESPHIVGADAAGVISGGGADEGRTVLINPCIGWDVTDDVPEVPTILGGPLQGTFAEYVAVPAVNVHQIPRHLSVHEAAALPLVGLTAYRALFTKGNLSAGDHLVITGASGGAAVMALSMAVAAGAEVTVVTRSAQNAQKALAAGAAHAVVADNEFDRKLTRPADLVLDGVGAVTVPAGLRALRPGGALISFGATTTPDLELSLREVFFRQISLLGSSMGSAPEFLAMLEFVSEHSITPVVHSVRPLEEAADAFRAMASGEGFGKTVLTM